MDYMLKMKNICAKLNGQLTDFKAMSGRLKTSDFKRESYSLRLWGVAVKYLDFGLPNFNREFE